MGWRLLRWGDARLDRRSLLVCSCLFRALVEATRARLGPRLTLDRVSTSLTGDTIVTVLP